MQGVPMRYGSGDQDTVLPDDPLSATPAIGSLHRPSLHRPAADRVADESQTEQYDIAMVGTQGTPRLSLVLFFPACIASH